MARAGLSRDIIELVVYHYRDDNSTLQNHSLISPDFLVACRRHLFYRIRLPTAKQRHASSSPCHRLYTVLQGNSSIVRYIRTLQIVNNSNWTPNELSFPKLLELIANEGVLSELSFNMMGSIHWPTVSEGYRLAVYKILASPSLETVVFHRVCPFFPPQAFGECPALRYLEFFADRGCHQVAENTYTFKRSLAVQRNCKVKLDTLSFNNYTAPLLNTYLFNDSEDCLIDVTQLSSLLVAGISESTLQAALQVINASSDNLSSLSWKIPDFAQETS
jgi:hypothetical protein